LKMFRGFTCACLSILLVLACFPAWTQAVAPASVERKYSYSADVVKKALEQIGAAAGARLPALDGFVSPQESDLDHYERPYYQYRFNVISVDPYTSIVKVEAHVTAWYVDPQPSHSQYRVLPSNGRLEADLLDRLQEALAGQPPLKTGPGPQSKPAVPAYRPSENHPPEPAVGAAARTSSTPSGPRVTPQEQLDAILSARQSVREKASSLQAEIDGLKTAKAKSDGATKFASLKHSGVGVMSRMNFGGPVLFHGQAEDEYEVISVQSGWAEVRLGPGSTAYIQADELDLPDGIQEKPAVAETVSPNAKPDPARQPDLGFWVSREDVNVFSGDWARLKGKKVLFVYAQSRGLLAGMAVDDAKLAYAKRVFESRYRTVSQSGPDVEGVVVVFLGSKGGVAAATFADIRQWVEGGLGDEAFINRCSLDPPAEFGSMRLN
jgi:hypothetical protein